MPIVHTNCFTDAPRGRVSKLAYAWEKLLELPQCEKKRLYLIASGVDIYRTQIARELRPISFRHLRPIHIVTDQAGTSAKMHARAQKLREFARSLPPGQKVTSADVDRLMPSVTPFRAVEDADGHVILFEGVGRYYAIREALGEDAALDISVEVFRTKDPARTLRLVHDVQRANGLRPGLPGPLLHLIGPANSSNPGFLAQVWEHGLVRMFVKVPAPEVPHLKALAPIADASALTVVRDTVSSTLRSAAENRISGLLETKAGEFDALIAGDYRFDEIRAEREAGRASPHDARKTDPFLAFLGRAPAFRAAFSERSAGLRRE
jgi:hypothetical protein